MNGRCRLCDRNGTLCRGHVWPSFAYKRWVSDHSKGGRFADLAKQQEHNTQYARYWFCHECDSSRLGDGEAARFFERLERDPEAEIQYDHSLLKFAVSVSLRTL